MVPDKIYTKGSDASGLYDEEPDEKDIEYSDDEEEMMAKKASEMGPDEMDAWATRTPKLWKLLDETSKAIERGAFGVTAYEETSLKGSDDALRRFRQNNQ